MQYISVQADADSTCNATSVHVDAEGTCRTLLYISMLTYSACSTTPVFISTGEEPDEVEGAHDVWDCIRLQGQVKNLTVEQQVAGSMQ